MLRGKCLTLIWMSDSALISQMSGQNLQQALSKDFHGFHTELSRRWGKIIVVIQE